MSDSVRPHRRQPTRLHRPRDSPGKNTGVGCHFLLQCMKMKSLSLFRLLVTPWTAAHQAPPSMGFSRQEYWSGVPLPSPLLTTESPDLEPDGSDHKESAHNVRDLGSIPGLGRCNPLQYFCLEYPHGQRSLAGYRPWGGEESDATKQLSTQHRPHSLHPYFK